MDCIHSYVLRLVGYKIYGFAGSDLKESSRKEPFFKNPISQPGNFCIHLHEILLPGYKTPIFQKKSHPSCHFPAFRLLSHRPRSPMATAAAARTPAITIR